MSPKKQKLLPDGTTMKNVKVLLEMYQPEDPLIVRFQNKNDLKAIIFKAESPGNNKPSYYSRITENMLTNIVATPVNYLFLGKIYPENVLEDFSGFLTDFDYDIEGNAYVNLFICCNFLNTGAGKMFNNICASLEKTYKENYDIYWFYFCDSSDEDETSEKIDLISSISGACIKKFEFLEEYENEDNE